MKTIMETKKKIFGNLNIDDELYVISDIDTTNPLRVQKRKVTEVKNNKQYENLVTIKTTKSMVIQNAPKLASVYGDRLGNWFILNLEDIENVVKNINKQKIRKRRSNILKLMDEMVEISSSTYVME